MKIPDKCIECIINHIEENDIKTLRSTALVNRDWCKFAVIRLWRTPLSFSNSNPNSKSRSTKSIFKIVPILLSFLDSGSRKAIKTSSRQFYVSKDTTNFYPKLQSNLKIPIYDLKIPSHKLSFEYPKYIKHVNFVDLVVLTNKWLNNLLIETLSTTSISLNFNLCKSLGKWEYVRYMTNSIHLHCPFISFDINPQLFFNFILESLFQVLINHSQIDSLYITDTLITHHLCNQLDRNNNDHFLSNLSRFEFCQTINSRILTKLSKLARDTITDVSIAITSEGSDGGVDGSNLNTLINFINSLRSLQTFSVLGNNMNVASVIQSLRNHTSTLTTLKLDLCTIDEGTFKSLLEYHQLRELTFHQLYFTFDDDSSMITSIDFNFPQLKKFNYWEFSSTNSIVMRIIQNNGSN